jgi:hypothetical protein
MRNCNIHLFVHCDLRVAIKRSRFKGTVGSYETHKSYLLVMCLSSVGTIMHILKDKIMGPTNESSAYLESAYIAIFDNADQ